MLTNACGYQRFINKNKKGSIETQARGLVCTFICGRVKGHWYFALLWFGDHSQNAFQNWSPDDFPWSFRGFSPPVQPNPSIAYKEGLKHPSSFALHLLHPSLSMHSALCLCSIPLQTATIEHLTSTCPSDRQPGPLNPGTLDIHFNSRKKCHFWDNVSPVNSIFKGGKQVLR